MRGWTIPRELLWALIGALTITVIAIWPNYYPYRQAPHVSGSAEEITILGIKPGEWLLSIVTLMLWASSAALVKGADRNAARQLRTYVVAEARGLFIHGPKSKTAINVQIIIKNTGQTPAHDLRVVSKTELIRHPVQMPFDFTLISGPDPSVAVLGAGEITETESRPDEPFDGNAIMVAMEPESGARIYIWGTVTYRDVFGQPQYTNFCSSIIFTNDQAVCHASEHHNDAS